MSSAVQFLLSSGALPVIKAKCGACNGCVEASPPTFESAPTASALDLCVNPCLIGSCPFFPDADCIATCGCTAEYIASGQVVTDQCTCTDLPPIIPDDCTVVTPGVSASFL